MIVGLTGGIGSGKTEVSRRFEQRGICVVDADLIARHLVDIGSPALNSIAAHFGSHILLADGALNRQELRNIVFNNPSEKLWLENLLHPIIRTEIITQLARSNSAYSILSSPLLLETHQHKLVDSVLVVDAPEAVQIERASQRDASNTEQIKKIIASQMNRTNRLQQANHIIYNHGNLANLDSEVEKLHQLYLQLAKKN